MSGGSLVTKGLISGGGSPGPGPTPISVLLPPPAEPAQFESTAPTGTVMIVVPTAINAVLMAAENITQNLLERQSSDLALPSMYKRAYLIAYETDEVAVLKE